MELQEANNPEVMLDALNLNQDEKNSVKKENKCNKVHLLVSGRQAARTQSK